MEKQINYSTIKNSTKDARASLILCFWTIITLTLATSLQSKNTPSHLPYNPRVNARVVAGFEHSLYIDGGKVLAHGSNQDGQSANGSHVYLKEPTLIEGLSNIIALSQGSSAKHTLALKEDGTVWAWGDNELGQLGIDNEDIINLSAPTMLTGIYGVVALAAGHQHSIALSDDGRVWTWGSNEYGQLGLATASKVRPLFVPKRVPKLKNVVSVAAGYHHSIALKKDGTVWTWGRNSHGQLGIDSKAHQSEPVKIDGLKDIVYVTAGASHCLAVAKDGTVWSWGWNDYGQLGTGNFDNQLSPIKIPIKNVVKIAAGGLHTTALTANGEVYAWGANTFGQIGKSMNRNYPKPVKVFALKDVVSLAAGDMHSLAILRDGTVKAWGSNSSYQLGHPDELSSATPISIYTITEKMPIAITQLSSDFPTILPIENRFEPINESLVEHDVNFNPNGNRMKGPTSDQTDNKAGLVPDDFGEMSDEECPVATVLKSININAVCTDDQFTTTLIWKAPIDILSLDFGVEKSIDNETWIEIETMPKVALSKDKSYHVLEVQDGATANKETYYRLKQINCDGVERYSAPVVLDCRKQTDQEVTILPELISDHFIINLHKGIPKGYKYEVVDAFNRVLLSDDIPASKHVQSLTISTQSIQGGLYLLRIVGKSEQETFFSKKIFKISE